MTHPHDARVLENRVRDSLSRYERASVESALEAAADARVLGLHRENVRLRARLADAVEAVARLHGELEVLRAPRKAPVREMPMRQAAAGGG